MSEQKISDNPLWNDLRIRFQQLKERRKYMTNPKDSNLGHSPSLINGTLYSCGCWHDGAPQNHSTRCPTHNEVWRTKYLDGQRINRKYQDELEKG